MPRKRKKKPAHKKPVPRKRRKKEDEPLKINRPLAKKALSRVYKKHVLLERSIFAKFKDPVEYNECVRRLFSWLSIVKNPRHNPKKMVLWSDDTWRRKHRESAKQWTSWQLEIMPKSLQPLDHTLIQCVACKKHAVTFYLKQTRSADEPMTRFNTCTACGKEWRSES